MEFLKAVRIQCPELLAFDRQTLVTQGAALGIDIKFFEKKNILGDLQDVTVQYDTQPTRMNIGLSPTLVTLNDYYERFETAIVQEMIMNQHSLIEKGQLADAVLSQFVVNQFDYLFELKEKYHEEVHHEQADVLERIPGAP